MNVSELRRAIPAAIDALGGDSRSSVLGPDAWAIFRGSATGYIALITPEGASEDDAVVHIAFPILQAPETGAEPIYRRVLELNHDLGAFACFSLDPRGKVWLGAARFAADLEESELRELIAQVAALADRYDDELLEEFGPELGVS